MLALFNIVQYAFFWIHREKSDISKR